MQNNLQKYFRTSCSLWFYYLNITNIHLYNKVDKRMRKEEGIKLIVILNTWWVLCFEWILHLLTKYLNPTKALSLMVLHWTTKSNPSAIFVLNKIMFCSLSPFSIPNLSLNQSPFSLLLTPPTPWSKNK